MHLGGKYWHPYGGSVTPGDNTGVVTHHDVHEGT